MQCFHSYIYSCRRQREVVTPALLEAARTGEFLPVVDILEKGDDINVKVGIVAHFGTYTYVCVCVCMCLSVYACVFVWLSAGIHEYCVCLHDMYSIQYGFYTYVYI